MEERLPESAVDATVATLALPPPPTPPRATLVVQVPRDQIYRVPPPEHAIKIEEHQRITQIQDANRRTAICSYVIPIVLTAVVAITALLIVRATLYYPTAPDFEVTSIRAKGLDGHSPEFKVVVQAKNSNTRLTPEYGEGRASLSFKNKKIGHGKIGSGTGDAALVVAVAGDGAAMTPEVKKSLTEDKEKSMGVAFDVTVEMKSWLRNEGLDMTISCEFRVLHSLMKVTEISFQECKKL